MVEIEKNRQQNGKRDRKKHLANTDIPQVHEPASISRWKERFRGRKRLDMDVLHVAVMDEASEEDDRQRRAVVLHELAHVSLEQRAFADHATDITAHQDEKGDHDAQIGRGVPRHAPLSGQDLDSLLEIDEGDVEPENVTGKSGDIGEAVAGVGNGKKPVENQRPTSGSQQWPEQLERAVFLTVQSRT